MKVHLETYLNTQDISSLTALIEVAQIIIREKAKEQEYYEKMSNQQRQLARF